MARVCWTDRAEESVLEIGRYIIEQTQSRQRGLDVINRVEEKCARYAQFPSSGTSREDIGPGLRCFRVDNLVVIYRPLEDGIVVILVTHGHRDIRTVVEQIFGSGGLDND
jgi:toxin ParE1/3/4